MRSPIINRGGEVEEFGVCVASRKPTPSAAVDAHSNYCNGDNRRICLIRTHRFVRILGTVSYLLEYAWVPAIYLSAAILNILVAA